MISAWRRQSRELERLRAQRLTAVGTEQARRARLVLEVEPVGVGPEAGLGVTRRLVVAERGLGVGVRGGQAGASGSRNPTPGGGARGAGSGDLGGDLGALDLDVVFAKGEAVGTELSHKYTRESAGRMLADGGLRTVRWDTDESERFAVALAEVWTP